MCHINNKFPIPACNNRGRIVTDRHVIFKKNINRYFVIDVISLLPLEIFAFASFSVLFTAALLRLNRILRFSRVIQLSNVYGREWTSWCDAIESVALHCVYLRMKSWLPFTNMIYHLL
ncbi:uncharacterized protein [Dysidea avara]|uniref:uncharacterized protein n=1 Tax=Dysidea avara TaxID=196820 RepID=UPI003321BE84